MDNSSFGIPSKLYIQIYRDAVRGGESQLRRYLSVLQNLSLGVVFHGFPRDLVRNHARLIRLANEYGLEPAFSWGLDSERDNDGSKLTAKEKGECMGTVLQAKEVLFGLEDAESAWDRDHGPEDETDERGALEMNEALFNKAPNAIVGDQPWFAMEVHGDERRLAKPIEHGGTFAGFPSDEFAKYLKFRAPQFYWNDFKRTHGKTRYAYVRNRMNNDWAIHETSLARLNLVRPRTVTIQGYEHEDMPWNLCKCLIEHEDKPVIMWSDPFPTDVTLRYIRAWLTLRSRGYTGPRSVASFQRDAGLREDNLLGHDTATALGAV